jgi:type I restriction enzyme M protein
LLPVNLAVKVFLNDLKQEFDEKSAALADIQEKQQTMIDEDEGYLDDAIFYGKLNEKNIRTKLERCNAHRLTEDEKVFLESLAPYLEKNNKANKEKIADLRKPFDYLFEDGQAITKKVVQKLLDNSELWEYSTVEQRNLWAQYLVLLESEKTVKAEIKVLDANLFKEIVRAYGELTEDGARNVIVNDKWLADISLRISDEMQTAMHRIVTEVNDMHSRYEFTLGELSQSFAEKEALVFNHLKEMGFEL